MTLSSEAAAQALARALADDRLAALVGAGASARFTDSKGRVHDGVPTPGQLIEIARKKFKYLSTDMTFNTSFDLLLEREKRAGVEKFLLDYYKVPETFELPPSDRLLALLPFSFYVTSNYDQFIERALERQGRRPFPLIDNSDLVRLRRWNTPVVKYHGCVSRPSTMVAATPEYELLEEKRKLIRNFVSASLCGSHVLVVGHGLADSDLTRIINELVQGLEAYAPAIYVLRPPGFDGNVPGLRYNHEVIVDDLTAFLTRLLHELHELRGAGAAPSAVDPQWFSSSFFGSLRQASVLPSETQVIDAFLGHLAEEIAARTDVPEVMSDAATAVDSALHERPNYGALRRVWQKVRDSVGSATAPHLAETKVRAEISERQAKIQKFTAMGPIVVNPNDRILLYSQSQRVLQVLRGAPVATQRTVHVFVCECRPKSPRPYDDAAATCAELADTQYKITVCPDVVGMNLLANKQIDKIIIGTHAVFCEHGANDIYSYINTCGSQAITDIAAEHGVPVFVIGESLKLEDVPRANAMDHLHPHQEDDLTEGARNLKDYTTRRGDVGHLNIGYDLIEVKSNTTVYIPDGAPVP